jgi:hypothetical protein
MMSYLPLGNSSCHMYLYIRSSLWESLGWPRVPCLLGRIVGTSDVPLEIDCHVGIRQSHGVVASL